MFDTLTTDQLHQLYARMVAEHTANHNRMMDRDGHARFSVFSEKWAVLSAHQAEVSETLTAVYAEIQRRDQEAARYA